MNRINNVRNLVKRGVSLITVLCLLAALCGFAGAVNNSRTGAYYYLFSDIAGSKLASEIAEGHNLGLFDGYGDGTFRPNDLVTRQAFCKMFSRAFARAGYQMPIVAQVGPFANSKAFVLGRASDLGQDTSEFRNIVNNGTEPATRRDMIVIMAGNTEPTYTSGQYMPFSDADVELMELVDRVNGGPGNRDVIGGFSDGTLRPGSALTRAQAVALVLRYYKYWLREEREETIPRPELPTAKAYVSDEGRVFFWMSDVPAGVEHVEFKIRDIDGLDFSDAEPAELYGQVDYYTPVYLGLPGINGRTDDGIVGRHIIRWTPAQVSINGRNSGATVASVWAHAEYDKTVTVETTMTVNGTKYDLADVEITIPAYNEPEPLPGWEVTTVNAEMFGTDLEVRVSNLRVNATLTVESYSSSGKSLGIETWSLEPVDGAVLGTEVPVERTYPGCYHEVRLVDMNGVNIVPPFQFATMPVYLGGE